MPESLKQASIHNRVLAEVLSETRRQYPLETGGILMGRWNSATSCEITDSIGPGSRATHRRTSFEPDYDEHVKRVAEIYHASDGQVTYLGDWHSHPGGGNGLSSQDCSALRSISKNPAARCQFPLMLLVCGGPQFNLYLWQWVSRSRPQQVAIPLTVIEVEAR